MATESGYYQMVGQRYGDGKPLVVRCRIPAAAPEPVHDLPTDELRWEGWSPE